MLNRIARYLSAQHWNAIAIEFVIVTAGVLMGIQVSNWNDDRLDKARAELQLASFHTELEGNLATVKRYQQGVEKQLRDVLALERAFDGNHIDDGDTDQKLISAFRISSMILETSAYDELNETGSLRYIAPDIRSAMTEWRARKGLIERADQDALSYRSNAVDQLLGVLAFEPMVRDLAPAFRPAGNPPVINEPARLAKDAKVRNFLAMRYGIETQKLQFAKDLERATQNLLALLDKRGGG
jgi:hypothetical protein